MLVFSGRQWRDAQLQGTKRTQHQQNSSARFAERGVSAPCSSFGTFRDELSTRELGIFGTSRDITVVSI